MSLVFRNALMPSEDQQALRLRLVYFMRRLFFSVLIAKTIFVQPLSLFAADMDVTPSQYKVGKFFASKFCEAREDGLSLESAYESAAVASCAKQIIHLCGLAANSSYASKSRRI